MINRVVLTGRLTKKPEVGYTKGQEPIAYCLFTLAVNRPRKNAQGKQEADFLNCVVWRGQAVNMEKYLDKGSLIGVDGRLQTRNYEGQNGKVYVTEVVADTIQYLESSRKTGGNGAPPPPDPFSGGNGGQNNNPFNDDPFANDGQPIDISNDDLPF